MNYIEHLKTAKEYIDAAQTAYALGMVEIAKKGGPKSDQPNRTPKLSRKIVDAGYYLDIAKANLKAAGPSSMGDHLGTKVAELHREMSPEFARHSRFQKQQQTPQFRHFNTREIVDPQSFEGAKLAAQYRWGLL